MATSDVQRNETPDKRPDIFICTSLELHISNNEKKLMQVALLK